MSFDTLNRYNPNHKVWDHVGNIIPDIEHSEGQRPALELKVASWLPVVFFDKHYENWYTVMPGKAISLDPNGDAMPAHYGAGGASVTYSQSDVDVGTIDVSTGLPVTTAGKVVLLDALNGTRGSGWTRALAGTADNSTYRSGFLGKFGVEFGDSVKYPIGVAPYGYLQWCGGDGTNPANYVKHNYNMQSKVAVLCDYVIRLPLVPAQVLTETVDKSTTSSALVSSTRAVHTRSYAVACASGRYNATYGAVPVLSTYPVIALALAEVTLAKNTARTTITMQSNNTADDVSSILVNERTSLAAVTQSGDYYVDYDYGVIFIYSSDGSTIPAAITGAAGTVSITYYVLSSAPSVVSKFACVVAGAIKPGDFLKVGADSNLVVATTEDFKNIIGQVIGFEKYPRDSLDMVRTSFSPALNTSSLGSMANATLGSASANLGQMDQMAGSATGGVPDAVNYAGAADTMVIINLVSR